MEKTVDLHGSPSKPSSHDPERRQLSILFCDLVGSTALSTQIDPETFAELISQYQRVCAEAIGRFDGFVARYLGDGLLAWFGYPVAHEDDAERAALAGLAVVQAVSQLQAPGELSLKVRVGIATGQVVVGHIGSQSDDVSGEPAHLAARLQSIAHPNEVVISQATYQLIASSLDCLGPELVQLAGFPRPVEIRRVLGQHERLDRFDARRAAGLTPFTGRDSEFAELLAAWHLTRAGQGQVVFIAGEAGIGKSRLLQEFKGQIADGSAVGLGWHGSPYMQNSPLGPVIRHFQHAAGFRSDDAADAKRAKLDALLARGPALCLTSAPIIAGVLSLPVKVDDPPLDPDPEQRKRLTLAVLVEWVAQHCSVRPVVLACEDLHWFDPTSRELLDLLIARSHSLPLLLIFTYRPESEPPVPIQPHVRRLNLQGLDPDAALAMASKVATDRQLSADSLRRVVARSDGVPLFIEELTKAASEADFDDPAAMAAIPVTLQDSLVARLDRLSEVKDVVQTGAAMGGEFSESLVCTVLAKPVEQVRNDLDLLVTSDLLHARPAHGDRFFVFRHSLLQDAAYGTLLRSRRRDIHQRIAETLERLFPDLRDNQPELLAQHWDRAAKFENAIHYLERAANHAIERSAALEANAHLRRALQLISRLTDGPLRDRVELPIVLKHGAVLRALQGPYGDDVGRAFERARELSRRTGDQQLRALDGLFVYHLVGARNAAAREIASEVLAMAEACGDRVSLMFGHSSLGMVALHTGDPVGARAHLQRAMQLYDVDADGPLAFVYGMDHAQTMSSFLALAFWVLGLPEQAIAQENWAIAHGTRLNHVYSLAQTGMFRIVRGAFARDWDAVAAIARETLEVGTRHSFRMPMQMSRFYLAFCRAIQEPADSDVLDQMHAVLRMRRGVNYYPFYLSLMAEAQAKCGDLAGALETIAEAQSTVQSTGERLVEPELLRLRGILLQQLNGVQAEASLRAALSEARRQCALGWALRAGVSLAEFLATTGRKSEAFEELRSVHVACDRTAVSPELQAAGELLRSLSA